MTTTLSQSTIIWLSVGLSIGLTVLVLVLTLLWKCFAARRRGETLELGLKPRRKRSSVSSTATLDDVFANAVRESVH
jgi:hypothetical protein